MRNVEFSDHRSPFLTTAVNSQSSRDVVTNSCRSMTEGGFSIFYETLSNISWDFTDDKYRNANECFGIFYHEFQKAFETP